MIHRLRMNTSILTCFICRFNLVCLFLLSRESLWLDDSHHCHSGCNSCPHLFCCWICCLQKEERGERIKGAKLINQQQQYKVQLYYFFGIVHIRHFYLFNMYNRNFACHAICTVTPEFFSLLFQVDSQDLKSATLCFSFSLWYTLWILLHVFTCRCTCTNTGPRKQCPNL